MCDHAPQRTKTTRSGSTPPGPRIPAVNGWRRPRPRVTSISKPSKPTAATLGPEATQWAQSLLEVARFELARADDKANTLFRFYGVVAALSIGLLAGGSGSPTNLDPAGQVFFWTGCAAFLASGFYLGMTLYPRDIRGTPSQRLLYFGHVIAYPTVESLAGALRSVDENVEHRLVEQLLSVSRLVHAKYALTRQRAARARSRNHLVSRRCGPQRAHHTLVNVLATSADSEGGPCRACCRLGAAPARVVSQDAPRRSPNSRRTPPRRADPGRG